LMNRKQLASFSHLLIAILYINKGAAINIHLFRIKISDPRLVPPVWISSCQDLTTIASARCVATGKGFRFLEGSNSVFGSTFLFSWIFIFTFYCSGSNAWVILMLWLLKRRDSRPTWFTFSLWCRRFGGDMSFPCATQKQIT
jgi:hypothetical protein